MASPVYSKTWPVPPPIPMRAISARMMSLALTPGVSRPSTRTSYVFGSRWRSVWVARTISTSLVPIPNASAPKAPCVLVCESPHTMVIPGWVSPSCGPMTWTIPCEGSADAVERHPELGAVRFELVDLRRGHLVEDRQAAVRRGDRVVGCRDGPIRMTDRQAAGAEPCEGLGARHLVDEMEVDGEDGGGARLLGDDVLGPDLVDDRAWGGHAAARGPRGSKEFENGWQSVPEPAQPARDGPRAASSDVDALGRPSLRQERRRAAHTSRSPVRREARSIADPRDLSPSGCRRTGRVAGRRIGNRRSGHE